MENTNWLSEWYLKNCDGDWEHQFGVKIETLDNPGWRVEIDLIGTRYSEITDHQLLTRQTSNTDWIICRVSEGRFQGNGDPNKLTAIIQEFRKWIENY